MSDMPDAEYPIYALFWALDGLMDIVVANWLLSVALMLILVEFAVGTIKRVFHTDKEDK